MVYFRQNQPQAISFVLVDAACLEVTGLGNTFNLEISKAGGAFAAGVGAKAEISNGWYHYVLTAAETDAIGPLAIRVWDVGTDQQNLLFFVREACETCVDFTYTVTDADTGLPIEGVDITITTDVAGNDVVWCGTTDIFGVARDAFDELPCLEPGVYQFWRQHGGYTFVNPDAEVVS